MPKHNVRMQGIIKGGHSLWGCVAAMVFSLAVGLGGLKPSLRGVVGIWLRPGGLGPVLEGEAAFGIEQRAFAIEAPAIAAEAAIGP
jgi:hypothetical protein